MSSGFVEHKQIHKKTAYCLFTVSTISQYMHKTDEVVYLIPISVLKVAVTEKTLLTSLPILGLYHAQEVSQSAHYLTK